MAWLYADYHEQPTTAAKIARAEKHLTELAQSVTASVSKDGASRSAETINTLMDQTMRWIMYYRGLPDARTGGTTSKARLG